MTQEEFFTKLDNYLESEETVKLIPPLIAQAKSEGLSIYIAITQDANGEDTVAYIKAQGRQYLSCIAPKDKTDCEDHGLKVEPVKMDGFFEELKQGGYGGITLLMGDNMVVFPWKRILVDSGTQLVAKVGPNDPCPCGSGKKYKKCCGRG